MGEFKQKINKIRTKDYTKEQIINLILYMTIILVPLIITDSHWPYIDGKLIVLYILGSLALIFGFRNIIRPFVTEKKIVFIFLITILIPSLLSPEKSVAFFGSAIRGEGFIMIAIYVILFLSATKYLIINNKGINIIFAIASLITIYGVVGFYGIDPIKDAVIDAVTLNSGAISTIGNRNFLSNYICIFLFSSSALYIFKKEKKYLFFAGIQFAGLLCALTRGGWLAFIIFSLVGLTFIIKRKDCLRRTLIILIAFIVIFGALNFTSNNAIITRADKDQIVSEDTELVGTASSRMEILRICWNAFKDRPFIGYGPDNLKTRLEEEYTMDAFNYMIAHKTYIDKAHNEYVEYAVSSGIFTLISYLALIGLIIKGLVKGIGNDINKVLLLTLVGYLVQAFFNISTIGVAPLFWIFLGYCIKEINGKNLKDTENVISP